MDPIPAAPASPPAGALYDSRRGVYYVKPVLRGWLHLLWFEASLVLGTLLVARAHGAVRITALAIYAASVSAMFGISALYHRGNWSAAWNRRLQRLDHAMIFLLIAGTATPAFLLATSGALPAGLSGHDVGADRDRGRGPPGLDERTGAGGRLGLRRAGLGRHSRATGCVDPCRGGGRRADASGRAAVYGGGTVLPLASARPLPGRVRLPRGLSRLRLRRRGVPVRRDRAVPHQPGLTVASMRFCAKKSWAWRVQ